MSPQVKRSLYTWVSCEIQAIILLSFMEVFFNERYIVIGEGPTQSYQIHFTLGDYSMNYKSRLTNLKLLPLM